MISKLLWKRKDSVSTKTCHTQKASVLQYTLVIPHTYTHLLSSRKESFLLSNEVNSSSIPVTKTHQCNIQVINNIYITLMFVILVTDKWHVTSCLVSCWPDHGNIEGSSDLQGKNDIFWLPFVRPHTHSEISVVYYDAIYNFMWMTSLNIILRILSEVK